LRGVIVRRLLILISLGILGFAVGCGGGSSASSTSTPPSSTPPSNVLSVAVDGGPTANQMGGTNYANAAFASATICAPGSTVNCVTIDHLLVDTGSNGLRVFQSEVSALNLPTVNASDGSAAYDCVSFVDGAFLWGPVQQADVTLGGETANKMPLQVISSATTGIPTSCSNGSTDNQNSQATLGANGVLGVGLEPTDCFYNRVSVCDPASGVPSPPSPAYYTCSGTSCIPAFISVANQVTNPVALFATDNNGVIVELPAVSGSAPTLTGSLIFGIGTETNNKLPSSATVFTLVCDDFTTTFDGQTFGITDSAACSGAGSFIDTGSNALYFPNVTKIPTCPTSSSVGDISGFYCPTSTDNLSATNAGVNGSTKTSNFSVSNAEDLFTTPATSSDAALGTLAGPNPSGVGFDWGLPFFYGVPVYIAIDAQDVPTGAPVAPWWAY
jgi:Protein of unknown function (DUF3443)